jgi:4'-phosphopantetheinyl transferase
MVDASNKYSRVGPADFRARPMPFKAPDCPGPSDVHLWYLNLGELAESLQHALSGDRAAGGELKRGQLRFVRRFYLRLLLGAYLGIPGKAVKINRGKRGKPVLDESVHQQELHFSMAKSEDRLLLGITSTGAVGVDLEPANRRAHNPRRVAGRYFSRSEARAFERIGEERLDQAFLRTWACKEAVVKASGEGIANQLCRFTVETDPDRDPVVLDFQGDDAGLWSLEVVMPDQGFIGAVATRNSGMDIQAFRVE